MSDGFDDDLELELAILEAAAERIAACAALARASAASPFTPSDLDVLEALALAGRSTGVLKAALEEGRTAELVARYRATTERLEELLAAVGRILVRVKA